jgi:hypothetical protein
VLAEPERVAAIFHVRTESAQAVRFREYVVCSAAMVSSWSVATPAIRAELDAEIELLRMLREWVNILPADEVVLPASRVWSRVPSSRDPATQVHRALRQLAGAVAGDDVDANASARGAQRYQAQQRAHHPNPSYRVPEPDCRAPRACTRDFEAPSVLRTRPHNARLAAAATAEV